MRWRVVVAAAVTAIVAGDLAAMFIYEARVRSFALQSASQSARYDAGVVFFGGFDALGQLDEETRRRLRDARHLQASGRVRELIVVGGAHRGRIPVGARVMRDSLVADGVPADRVTADSTSFDSVTNWEQALSIAGRLGVDSLLLVSAPRHLYRLRRITRRSVPTVGFYVNPGGEPGSPGFVARWRSAHREGLALLAVTVLPRSWYVPLVRLTR